MSNIVVLQDRERVDLDWGDVGKLIVYIGCKGILFFVGLEVVVMANMVETMNRATSDTEKRQMDDKIQESQDWRWLLN